MISTVRFVPYFWILSTLVERTSISPTSEHHHRLKQKAPVVRVNPTLGENRVLQKVSKSIELQWLKSSSWSSLAKASMTSALKYESCNIDSGLVPRAQG